MNELCDLIEAALTKLPILPEREQTLDFWVNFVEVTLGPIPSITTLTDTALSPHDHQRLFGHSAEAARELRAIADKLKVWRTTLRDALQELSPMAQQALDTDLVEDLKRFKEFSEAIEFDIRHAAFVEAEWARKFPEKPGGRPRDYASREVAEAAGFAFEGTHWQEADHFNKRESRFRAFSGPC